jgi:hypothetical protein
MALEKVSVVDRIEVVEVGVVQVRTATRIVEDGNVISTSYHRHCINPQARTTAKKMHGFKPSVRLPTPPRSSQRIRQCCRSKESKE